MAKIALVSLPWSHLFGSYSNVAKAGVFYPPLGLCYLASALKQRKHEVFVLDAEAEQLNLDDLVEKVRLLGPDAVGITAVSPLIGLAENFARAVKSHLSVPVILGGPHITIEKKKVLSSSEVFDIGVVGEGEKTIQELMDALETKSDLAQIKGIIFRTPQGLSETSSRERETDLDTIPFPDHTVIDTNKYLWSVPGKGIVPLMTVLTSRGCPYRCVFCSQDKMYGHGIRFRSPANVAEGIERIVSESSVRHIIFCDDAITIKRAHIEGLCDEILKRKIRITFEGWTRADVIDKELIQKMKAAGLVRLSFGIESGDPEILRLIQKGETLEQIQRAYRIVKSVRGIETRGSMIIGLPNETKKTAWKTIHFARKFKELDHLYLNIAMPYPGTPLRDMALRSEHGMHLIFEDYTALRRYGNALIEVNDLKREDLIRLQCVGLLLFYGVPSRILYNLRRAGIRAGLLNGTAFFLSFFKIMVNYVLSAARRIFSAGRI